MLLHRHLAVRIGTTFAIALSLSLLGCASPEQEKFHATGRDGIVVTEDDYATQAAVEILRSGGNAIDAAVTAAFVMAVTFPSAGNIGGGGFVVVRDGVCGDIWSLDFREVAPEAATHDMYVRLDSIGLVDGSLLGPSAAGIPGTPAGLHAIWLQGGSTDWATLLRPAIDLARNGFVVSPELGAVFVRVSDALGSFESTRALFFENDEVLRSGDTLVQSRLGEILEQIAIHGPSSFYEGPIAKQLVEDVRANGGIWSLDDLLSYKPIFREPVEIPLDDDEDIVVYTMAPPTSGALVIAQSFAFMHAQHAFEHDPDSPERSAALAESFRLAFADRNTKLADPDFDGPPIASLISKAYLEERAALLPAAPPGNSAILGEGLWKKEPDDTTHIVVMDSSGNVVSLTYTLNGSFGSKWISPRTGVLLNNEMDDFDTRPGEPNLYDLVGSGVNIVRPKARMLSSITPTIVLRAGEPWFALGASGGPRIASAVVQVIMNRWMNGMTLPDAVAHPRVHHQWLPETSSLDEDRQIPGLGERLRGMGYQVDTKPSLGKVFAAERLADGRFVGVCDPRAGGWAMAVK